MIFIGHIYIYFYSYFNSIFFNVHIIIYIHSTIVLKGCLIQNVNSKKTWSTIKQYACICKRFFKGSDLGIEALKIEIFLANTVDKIYQLHFCEFSIIANISVGMVNLWPDLNSFLMFLCPLTYFTYCPLRLWRIGQ